MPLPFTGTGEETRDFTFVGDIVDGLLRAGYFEEAIGEEFNLASGREVKILEMAEKVNALVGNKAGILRAPPRVWDTKKRLLASVEKAGKLIGYNPDQDFDEGLKITVQWFKDNWEAIDRDAEFPPGMSSAVSGVTDDKELEVPGAEPQAKAS
jgi:nucleoside-diphosphate-sugar epimerase